MPGTLYRTFGADGELLYVGSTLNIASRLTNHRQAAKWWADAARIELEHFATREEASAAENAAIAAESPQFNVAGVRRAVSDAELEKRRERRAAQLRKQEEEQARIWRPMGRVTCGNCGKKPAWLTKGLLISEEDCPNCGCRTLALASDKATA